MLSIQSHQRGADGDKQGDSTTCLPLGNCIHYCSLLIATQNGTKHYEDQMSCSTKLNIALSCIQKPFLGTCPTGVKMHVFTDVYMYASCT